MGRFGVGYGGWFGSGLEGFCGGFGFKVPVSHMVIVELGCETVGLFKIFRPGGTHDIADGWRESTGVLLDCLGNSGDLMRAQNTKLLEPNGVGCVVSTDLLESPEFLFKLLKLVRRAELIKHELLEF